MQSLQNKKSLIIFALIYSLVVMVAMLFPFYLYVQESIEISRNRDNFWKVMVLNKSVNDLRPATTKPIFLVIGVFIPGASGDRPWLTFLLGILLTITFLIIAILLSKPPKKNIWVY